MLRGAAILTLSAGLTWWLVPRVATTSWSHIAALMASVDGAALTGLGVLWAIGLVLHTAVLTGSLPGLSHRRALTLNLTGSAVSNLLPGGGAAGVATNLMMMRRWSVPTASFTAFTLVSNAWDVAAKLILPVLAVTLVLLGGTAPTPVLLVGALISAAGLATLAVVGFAALRGLPTRGGERDEDGPHSGPAHRVARRMAVTTREALPMAMRTARAAWPRLTGGMLAYVATQAVLLWACLAVLDSPVTTTALIAAFAVERLMTLIPITPAGTGFAEAGAVTVLIAMGCPPASATAGVLLYRMFTVVLEIPVGALWLAAWTQVSALPRSQRSPA